MTTLKYPGIPVLYYHSIADHERPRPWSFLSYPTTRFEKHVRFLSKNGYTGITLEQLFQYMETGELNVKKPVVIQFDDGFLDNWVFAFPILQRYEMRATIYVNPEFTDPVAKVRPNSTSPEFDSSKISSWWGYLSWNEMAEMEKSDLIDIQSHALTHTWYFTSPNIIDFEYPGHNYYWCLWNRQPELKYAWLTGQNLFSSSYGSPIYEHKKSLTSPRYFPNERLSQKLIKYVEENGGTDFFHQNNWRSQLYNEADRIKEQLEHTGKFESKNEYLKRIKRELLESKKIIEEKLNKKVHFLCWPGGGNTNDANEIAYRVGYKSTSKGVQLNKFGADPKRISRLSAIGPLKLTLFQDKLDLIFLKLQLSRGRGNKIIQWISTVMKRILITK